MKSIFLLAAALCLSAVSATSSGIVKRAPVVCNDGVTYCDGCQCCPDGFLCSNAATDGSCPSSTCPQGRNAGSNTGNSGTGSASTTASGSTQTVTVTSTVWVTSTIDVTSTVGSTSTTVAPVNSTTTTISSPTTGSGSASATSHQVTVINKCNYTVWPGLLGSKIVNNGGWQLSPGASNTVTLPTGWSGRIWGRTGCNFDSNGRGFCATGDCGGVLQCNGAGGNPPATLAEITFNGAGQLDFYDVSLVDGYNVPISFRPVQGSYSGAATGYSCTSAGCLSDLNAICPAELQQVVNGQVVACLSACEKFNTDQFCCRGANSTPETCNPKTWAVDYAAIFKQACPGAYSYAYDDPTSTFTCLGAPQVDYQVVFCN